MKKKKKKVRQSQQTNFNESNETVILEVGKESTYYVFISLFAFNRKRLQLRQESNYRPSYIDTGRSEIGHDHESMIGKFRKSQNYAKLKNLY